MSGRPPSGPASPVTSSHTQDINACEHIATHLAHARTPPPLPPPKIAMRPFKLSESYTAPKGAFIIPDIVSACHQGFTNAKQFDPDRFR